MPAVGVALYRVGDVPSAEKADLTNIPNGRLLLAVGYRR